MLEQNGWYFADNIFKCILLKEEEKRFLLEVSLMSCSKWYNWQKVSIDLGNGCHQTGSKPLPDLILTQI